MKLTKAQAEKWHKELWLWLSKDAHRGKCGWPEWESNGGKVPEAFSNCFACQWSMDKTQKRYPDFCRVCPIKWPRNKRCVAGNERTNLFYLWNDCENGKERKELAKQIAELPWKKESRKCKS